MDTIEKKVADSILQRSNDTLEIDGNVYPVAQPTPATLILISEQISFMPDMDIDSDNILFEVLAKSKDCKALGTIAATLILGAKRIKENRIITAKKPVDVRRFSWRKFRFVTVRKEKEFEVNELDHLSELILDNCTTQTIRELITKRLKNLQIGDFFGLTTSLSEANLLKRTKEVETVSGE